MGSNTVSVKKEIEDQPDEDEIVSEVGIIVLPNRAPNVNFNRLQFQSKDTRQQSTENGAIQLKRNVKRLQIKIPQTNGNGLANGVHTGQQQEGMNGSSKEMVVTGDGLAARNGIVNNVFGFFSGGKLFLLPVHNTYDMQVKVVGKTEKKPTKDEQNKNAETTGNQFNSPINANKNAALAPQPLRVKFAKRESEAQRKRREGSSLHKQRLINDDPWIPLTVSKKHPVDMYKQVVGQALGKNDAQSAATTTNSAAESPKDEKPPAAKLSRLLI